MSTPDPFAAPKIPTYGSLLGAMQVPLLYATFARNIDQASLQSILNNFAIISRDRPPPHVHMMFNSPGGIVGDGIALYNYFRALPFDLTLYNPGEVSSVAAVAFLGAKHRKTSARATFMIHSVSAPTQVAGAEKLKRVTESVVIDDERVQAILRDHLTLSDEQWKELVYHNLIFGASDSVTIGFADDIAEFAPPPGTQIFNF